MNPKIHVILDLPYYPESIRVSRELSMDVLEKCSTSIDYPSNSETAIFCTPMKTRIEICKERDKLAQMLSSELTDAIIKILCQNDTIDGYK